MRRVWIVIAAAISMIALFVNGAVVTGQSRPKESPFACNINALDRKERERWLALLKKLRTVKQDVSELDDGYAFQFPNDPGLIQELAEFIGYEQRCCPFFDLELVVGREGGPIWLRLKGRKGVKGFIRTEFGLP